MRFAKILLRFSAVLFFGGFVLSGLFGHDPWIIITFVGTAGGCIGTYMEQKNRYDAVKATVIFHNRKAEIIKNYFRITTIVHIAYTVLNMLCAFFTEWLLVGIVPLGIHAIISNIILWNMKDALTCKKDERYAIEFWGTAEVGSYIIAFLSVLCASAIAG